jgi:hypothetical protein
LAITAIRDFFEKERNTRFAQIEDHSQPHHYPYQFVGYSWKDNGKTLYLVLPARFKEMWCKNISQQDLVNRLTKLNYFARNANGKIMETKHIPYDGNVRGYIFDPQVWDKQQPALIGK